MENKHFLAAMYLRLSREDRDAGDGKLESNSIRNQRELIRAFIQEQRDIDLFDIYIEM